MRIEELKKEKVALLGLGDNHKFLAEYLEKAGVNFDVITWDTLSDLNDKLTDYSLIFRTPGVPYLTEPIQNAQKKGASISSQTKLFFDLCPGRIIGVTGTKGKGTTSTLIYEIIIKFGIKAFLAGNIGSDPFEFLDDVKREDVVVLELSSFQLQDLEKSPNVAVVLNITQDHLDHHKDVNEYIHAKTSIIKYQKESDHAVLFNSLPKWFKELGKGQKIFFERKDGAAFETKLLGPHNQENIAAAYKVSQLFGVDEKTAKEAIKEFRSLPHRLQVVGIKDGITYVNDSFSTNVETTIAAINSFSAPIILILGGFDKGLDYTPLGKAIVENSHIKAVVVVGKVADKILNSIKDFKGKISTNAKSMKEIIDSARGVASEGDIILLSPAAASFDMFKNYKDRGDQFSEGVLT